MLDSNAQFNVDIQVKINNKVKNKVLKDYCKLIIKNKNKIIDENKKDIKVAEKKKLKENLIKRLSLNNIKIETIIKSIRKSDEIYLALDPDREGELIAWHLVEICREKKLVEGQQFKRIEFL